MDFQDRFYHSSQTLRQSDLNLRTLLNSNISNPNIPALLLSLLAQNHHPNSTHLNPLKKYLMNLWKKLCLKNPLLRSLTSLLMKKKRISMKPTESMARTPKFTTAMIYLIPQLPELPKLKSTQLKTNSFPNRTTPLSLMMTPRSLISAHTLILLTQQPCSAQVDSIFWILTPINHRYLVMMTN